MIFCPQKDTLWDDLHILGIEVENTNISFQKVSQNNSNFDLKIVFGLLLPSFIRVNKMPKNNATGTTFLMLVGDPRIIVNTYRYISQHIH